MSETRPPENNFLADLAGVEFECSIAAAELNKDVHKIMGWLNDKEGQDFRIVGYRGGEFTQSAIYPLRYQGDPPLRYGYSSHDQTHPLVLIQPRIPTSALEVAETPAEAPAKSANRWRNVFTRKGQAPAPVAIAPETPKYTLDDPMLGVQIDDVIVPIATFAQRLEAEHCSYIQLGSEMTGDTLFATQLDEGTHRNDIVEALRDAVSGKERDFDPSGATRDLIDAEFARNDAELKRLLTEQVGRSTRTRLRNQKSQDNHARLVEPTANGTIVRDVLCQPLSPSYGIDGIASWLVLASEDAQAQSATLGLLHRGAVYAPAINFAADGSYELPGNANISVEALISLNRLIQNRPLKDAEATVPAQLLSHESVKIERYARTIALGEEYRPNVGAKLPLPVVSSAYAVAFSDFLSGRTVQWGLPGRRDKLMDHIKNVEPYYQSLFAALGTTAVKEVVETDTPANEKLLTLLGHLAATASGVLRGSLQNMQIGKTVGDLDFEANISAEESHIRLTLGSRPSAMPHEQFRRLFDQPFNLLGRAGLPDERAADLAEVLRVLEVSPKGIAAL